MAEKIKIPKELRETLKKEMDMYKQKLFSRETANAYQILLHIAQLLQSYGYKFTDFERFYELLNGNNEDGVAEAKEGQYNNWPSFLFCPHYLSLCSWYVASWVR